MNARDGSSMRRPPDAAPYTTHLCPQTPANPSTAPDTQQQLISDDTRLINTSNDPPFTATSTPGPLLLRTTPSSHPCDLTPSPVCHPPNPLLSRTRCQMAWGVNAVAKVGLADHGTGNGRPALHPFSAGVLHPHTHEIPHPYLRNWRRKSTRGKPLSITTQRSTPMEPPVSPSP